MADEKNTTQTSTSLSLEAQLPRIQQGLDTAPCCWSRIRS